MSAILQAIEYTMKETAAVTSLTVGMMIMMVIVVMTLIVTSLSDGAVLWHILGLAHTSVAKKINRKRCTLVLYKTWTYAYSGATC